MEASNIFMVSCTLLLLCSSTAYAKTAKSHSITLTPTPAPAPAPAPHHVNLTYLLSVAGPFSTFLDKLISTKIIDTFQNQANNTEEGVTIFVPKDNAFSSLKSPYPSLANLTQNQLKSLLLFHGLPHYYALADFKNLSQTGSVPTFAGGDYTLNFTDKSGTVLLNTGWTSTKVSSAVYSTDPVAVYQVDRVLLPEVLFGTDIPPMPAPAPAPIQEIAPEADAPTEKSEAGSSKTSPKSSPDSSYSGRVGSMGVWIQLLFATSGMLVLFL